MVDPDAMNKLCWEAAKYGINKGMEWMLSGNKEDQGYGPKPSVIRPWKPVVQYFTFDEKTEMIAIYLPGLAPYNTVLSYDDGIINVSWSRFLESWLTDSYVAYQGQVPVSEKDRRNKEIVFGVRMNRGVLKVVINDEIRTGGYKAKEDDEPADEGKHNLQNFPVVQI